MTPEERYAQLTKDFLRKRGVTIEGRGFGAGALRIEGSIFAMLTSKREFVVKLSRDRVDQLIESGVGKAFDSGKGRPLKEWLALQPSATRHWEALATEAKEFVGSRKAPTRRPPPRKGEGNR